ncbi:MAG: hypothetical protein ACRDOI_04700, partial [Trebonia sp.]
MRHAPDLATAALAYPDIHDLLAEHRFVAPRSALLAVIKIDALSATRPEKIVDRWPHHGVA